MRIVGYADRLAVSPGDDIRFKVSCEGEDYAVAIERLWHGDLNPAGPGFKADTVASPVDGSYAGRQQQLHPGSYVRIPDDGSLAGLQCFTLCCWAFPTLAGEERRGLLTRWSETTGAGYGLFIGAEWDLVLMLGTGQDDPPIEVRTRAPLDRRRWYLLACTVDLHAGVARLYQLPRERWPDDPSHAVLDQAILATGPLGAGGPFLIAASDSAGAATGFFNGKIDRPAVFSRALAPDELQEIREGCPGWLVDGAAAAWDFSLDIGGSRVTNRSGHGRHGDAVNMPTRGVTGHDWTGAEERFSVSAAEHGAIHFHDDDLEDAGWETDFELAIPRSWQSGIYATRLRAGDAEDHIPFIVRPAKEAAAAPIAFLVPTLTYMAYANEHLATAPGGLLDSLGLTLDEYLASDASPYEQSIFYALYPFDWAARHGIAEP